MKTKLKLFGQLYTDEPMVRLFAGKNQIKIADLDTLQEGTPSAGTRALAKLGLKPVKWRKTEWGWQSNIVRD